MGVESKESHVECLPDWEWGKEIIRVGVKRTIKPLPEQWGVHERYLKGSNVRPRPHFNQVCLYLQSDENVLPLRQLSREKKRRQKPQSWTRRSCTIQNQQFIYKKKKTRCETTHLLRRSVQYAEEFEVEKKDTLLKRPFGLTRAEKTLPRSGDRKEVQQCKDTLKG